MNPWETRPVCRHWDGATPAKQGKQLPLASPSIARRSRPGQPRAAKFQGLDAALLMRSASTRASSCRSRATLPRISGAPCNALRSVEFATPSSRPAATKPSLSTRARSREASLSLTCSVAFAMSNAKCTTHRRRVKRAPFFFRSRSRAAYPSAGIDVRLLVRAAPQRPIGCVGGGRSFRCPSQGSPGADDRAQQGQGILGQALRQRASARRRISR